MDSQLRSLVARAWQLHRRFSRQSWLVRPSAPVLYFGDREAYAASARKVITVGLNPSNAEFPEDDPFRRFPGAESGNADAYLNSLNSYFRTKPYTAWFDLAFESILNGLDCSYYYDRHASVALHTDLCSPLATSPTWSKLLPAVREKLKPEGVKLWHDLVRLLNPDVIIISVARRYLDLIEFPAKEDWRCIYKIQRENPYEVLARRNAINGDKSALMVSGRAANHPFGTVSKVDKETIGKAIKNMSVKRTASTSRARIDGNTNQDRLCFVQFLHPGVEHRPGRGNVKEWNHGLHRRKFMRLTGRCVRRGKEHRGDLLAWGEWEPQSTVIKRIDDPLPHGPRFVYRPYYSLPRSYRGLQNTDPFIFGGFRYTGCQQHTVKGPTQLRFLRIGSVILFGSYVSGQFALDTVLVVRSHLDFDRRTPSLRRSVPRGFWDVTLAPLFGNRPTSRGCVATGRSLRLYTGATYDEPLDGMFSFFPAWPCAEISTGFTRPIIKLSEIVNGSIKQGKKLNPQQHVKDLIPHWTSVCRQVEDQGCWLGVHADMPPEQ